MINEGDKVRVTAIAGKFIPDNWRDLIYTITKKEHLPKMIYYEFMDAEGNYYDAYNTKGMIKIK